ncbi:hypothetical protein PIROE2DRAFT_67271 [Piromyces sp. E2]|nr:hypothetical protein PIROE2DRAFT_67271 [Piromyces sp. E2]|eukprot:OUM64713.1 hypothetical protein PIROE2DRAFT_67271 [Piromyces sp. E2]
MDKKHKRYSSSAAILNGYNYANYASSSSSSSNSSDDDDDDDDDDDEIPLAMLKNKRSSIITI